jgi:hypothetical protein
MKKICGVVAFVVMISAMSVAFAGDQKVTVKFTSDELAFSVSALNSIDLSGDEVNAFVDVKNEIFTTYKDVSASRKTSGDVSFTLPEEKNFLFFMRRVKLKGAEATLFNDVTAKIIDTLKKESK